MVIKYTEKLETNIKSELHEGAQWIHKTKQKQYCKKTSQKIAVVTIRTFTSDSHLYQQHPCIDNAPIQWAMRTLVIQRDFYTSIIVIVAFDAGIEAGSINYLPYIVLHARLYTIARRWIYIKRYNDPIVKAPVAVQWTV